MTYRLRGLRGVALAAMIVFAAVATGCSSSGEDAADDPGSGGSSASGSESTSGEERLDGSGSSGNAGSASGPEQTTTPEGTPGASAGGTAPEDGRVLPGKLYVDSDGNRVPDFVEVAEGYDPAADDCARAAGCPGPSGASGTSAADLASREQNILLVLDSSGSMAEPIGGGQTRMDAAKASLERYATATPDFINLGFMVYGHEGSNAKADRAESCESAEVLEPPGEVDYRTFPRTLDTFKPTGWTPIEGALNEAGHVLSGEKEATNRVILVSDGLETCGGDPVAAARRLADSDIQLTIDVVGFDIPRAEEAQLRRIAEVSGGRYATVDNAEELQDYFDQQQRVFWQLFDQFYCLNDRGIKMFNCSNDFDIDVNNRMQELLGDAEGEQWDAMYEIKTRADEYLDESRYRMNDAIQQRKDEIQKDMNEVRERMNRRYDEDVSLSPSCPELPLYADSGEGPADKPKLLAILPHGLANSTGE